MFEKIFITITDFAIKNWMYLVAPFASGILTAFIVEAIKLTLKRAGKSWHAWWLVLLVSLIAGIITAVTMKDFYDSLIIFGFAVFVNFIVSVVFYEKVGDSTVNKIFKKYNEELDEKI